MPPLALLLAALIVNYIRHRQHKSTICSTCRPHIGPVEFTLGWAALTSWLWPHYCRPFYLRPDKENHPTRDDE